MCEIGKGKYKANCNWEISAVANGGHLLLRTTKEDGGFWLTIYQRHKDKLINAVSLSGQLENGKLILRAKIREHAHDTQRRVFELSSEP